MTERRSIMRLVFVAALLLCGCVKSPTDRAPALVLVAVAGNAQAVTAGHEVPIAPAVMVTSSAEPVAGVSITFAYRGPTGGFTTSALGGAMVDTIVVSDSTGTARVGDGWWGLNTNAGIDSLTVSAPGAAPIVLTATALPGSAFGYVKFAGDAQSAPVGGALAVEPAVKVVDEFGNGVPGVSATFTVASGSGSITGAATVTGSNGVATLGGWTLGMAPGINTLTVFVQAAGGPVIPLTFTATGTATYPTTLPVRSPQDR
jgi:hypothetical protein